MDEKIRQIIENYDYTELDALSRELKELARIRRCIDKGYFKLKDMLAYMELIPEPPKDAVKTLYEIFGKEYIQGLEPIHAELKELGKIPEYCNLVCAVFRMESERSRRASEPWSIK